jgi:acyl-CoA thioester hydrolase
MVAKLDIKYLLPAKLDDLLQIESEVTRLGRASLHFRQSIRRQGELLAQGNIQVCCVETVNMRVTAIPESIHTKFSAITRD